MSTVQAAILNDPTTGLELGEIELPQRHAGQALVEVRAASLNPLDLAVASGKWYGGRPALPYVPGIEGVGVVLEGDSLAPGTLIRFECPPSGVFGAFAARTVVDERTAIELPAGTPAPVASALGVAGWAGWLSVEWRARVVKGERVLVLGATGAVGQVAIQAAKLLGAGRVVAAGRNAKVLETVGADATVQLDGREPSALTAAFIDAAGGPIDVIIDMLWGEPAQAALSAIAPNGRMVNLGQSAGASATLASAALRGKGASLLGFTNFHVPLAEKKSALLRMLTHVSIAELTIAHETLPLARAAEGWRAQAASPNRKLIFVP